MSWVNTYSKTLINHVSISNFLRTKRHFCQEFSDTYVKALVRCEVQLDPELDQRLLSKDIRYIKHDGKREHGPLKVPERLFKAAHKVLENTSLDRKQMIKEAESFRNHVARRMLPATQGEIREKAQALLENIKKKDGIDVDILSDLGKETLQQSQMDRMQHKLKTMVYNWQPIEYNERNCMLYLLGCFTPNYAALHRIFDEIKKSVPDYKPKTFLDFGSGVGTGLWAVNECFEGSVSEALCVDANGEMNELAQLLLQDGDPNGDPWLQNIFFKRYLPPSNLIKYDLVVSAYSLMDMPTSRERLQIVNNLWNKTQDMLVIVEHGSYAGHSIILEAREYILNRCNQDQSITAGYVIAPCQHNLPCPKLLTTEKRPCSFPAKFYPLSFHKEKMPEMEKYSYVVLSKKKLKEDTMWPRLISPVLKRPNHVVCRMCNINGRLYESYVTKYKSGKLLYRAATQCKWGDLLPANVVKEEETPTVEDSIKEKDCTDDSAVENEGNVSEAISLK